jgi:hypothetical protein
LGFGFGFLFLLLKSPWSFNCPEARFSQKAVFDSGFPSLADHPFPSVLPTIDLNAGNDTTTPFHFYERVAVVEKSKSATPLPVASRLTERKARTNPLNGTGWKARKLPATGEVFFLDSLYRPHWDFRFNRR